MIRQLLDLPLLAVLVQLHAAFSAFLSFCIALSDKCFDLLHCFVLFAPLELRTVQRTGENYRMQVIYLSTIILVDFVSSGSIVFTI